MSQFNDGGLRKTNGRMNLKLGRDLDKLKQYSIFPKSTPITLRLLADD